jgi:hypothetical protein
MDKPDRNAFARRNATWLIPAFGAVMLIGILAVNFYAMAGGAFGLLWVAWGVWKTR